MRLDRVFVGSFLVVALFAAAVVAWTGDSGDPAGTPTTTVQRATTMVPVRERVVVLPTTTTSTVPYVRVVAPPVTSVSLVRMLPYIAPAEVAVPVVETPSTAG